MNLPLRFIVSALAALAFAGCAAMRTPSIAPGASISDVEASMGKPIAVVKAPDGDSVWQYPRGPFGQQTYMVRFGADQRVKSFTQALTFANLAKVQNGMTKDEIRLLLGYPTMEVITYRNLNQEAWSYRYLIPAADNRIFTVLFDVTTGRVRNTNDQVDELFNPINWGTGGGTGF
jgi:hypothetical protein